MPGIIDTKSSILRNMTGIKYAAQSEIEAYSLLHSDAGVQKGGSFMEDGRRKIRFCLAGIVLAALIIGICYCVLDEEQPDEDTGTLVEHVLQGGLYS